MQINVNSRKITNMNDLMTLIKKLITASWGSDAVTLVSAYPSDTYSKELQTPVITYKVKSKVPGEFNSVSEIKPRLREEIVIKDTNLPIDGETLKVMGQMFDYYIEFEIWASDGEEADRIAYRFQQFINKYKGYIKEAGVDRLIFKELSSNDEESRWRTDLVSRSIVYHFRIDEIISAKIPAIEDIIIKEFIHDSTYDMIVDILIRESELSEEE